VIIRKAFPCVELRPGTKADAWEAQTNGQNSALRIWTWTGIDNPVGTMAQELWEWRHRWAWGVLFALPGAALGVLLAIVSGEAVLFGTVPVLALLAFGLGPRLKAIQRRKELISHEVEVQCAVTFSGADAVTYRRKEAAGMGGYAWLKGMSAEDIEAEMVGHSARALKWVRANRKFLDAVNAAVKGAN
jgi:hypothetical protein